jgi:hypothetical protein
MKQSDVDSAFARASAENPVILGFADHDFRDMRKDIESVYAMVKKSADKFPAVKWAHAGAKEAARKVLNLPSAPLDFDVALDTRGSSQLLRVEARGQVFGPQPFLAVRTLDQRYIADNFDFQAPGKLWSYTLDQQSILPGSFDRIGIGAASPDGSTCVVVLDGSGKPVAKHQS